MLCDRCQCEIHLEEKQELKRRTKIEEVTAAGETFLDLAQRLGFPIAQIDRKRVATRWNKHFFAIQLALRERGASFPVIGKVLSRDHTTIIRNARLARELRTIGDEFMVALLETLKGDAPKKFRGMIDQHPLRAPGRPYDERPADRRARLLQSRFSPSHAA